MPAKFGTVSEVWVSIDEGNQTRLGKGASISLDVAPGLHSVEVDSPTTETSWEGEFEFVHGETIKAGVEATGFPRRLFLYELD